jgi:hypothetical protein
MLLNAAAIASPLLCGVCVFFWVASHSRTLWFGYEAWDGRSAIAMTEDGWVSVSVRSRRHAGYPSRSDCFPPVPRSGWVIASRPVQHDWTSLAADHDGRFRWWPPARFRSHLGGAGYSDYWNVETPYWAVAS